MLCRGRPGQRQRSAGGARGKTFAGCGCHAGAGVLPRLVLHRPGRGDRRDRAACAREPEKIRRVDEEAGRESMSITLYVPGDAAALALGADEVAAAIIEHANQLKLDINIVRNGSRGLFWLEPLVEVVTAQGRIAYGPVTAVDVPKLFAADFLQGGKHALRLGDIEAHPYL